jgi:outer membrane protein
MKNLLTTFVFVLLSTVVQAQDTLTLQSAIEMALRQNYSIQIARNQSDIATNNNTIGNAGFLPSVTAAAVASSSNTSIRQEFNNGNTINRAGAAASAVAANVALSWTIFDGLKMFATRDRLS